MLAKSLKFLDNIRCLFALRLQVLDQIRRQCHLIEIEALQHFDTGARVLRKIVDVRFALRLFQAFLQRVMAQRIRRELVHIVFQTGRFQYVVEDPARCIDRSRSVWILWHPDISALIRISLIQRVQHASV